MCGGTPHVHQSVEKISFLSIYHNVMDVKQSRSDFLSEMDSVSKKVMEYLG